MTEEERNAAWGRNFDVALGDFDKRLQRERVEIEQQQRAGGGGGSGGNGAGSGGGVRGGGKDGESGAATGGSGAGGGMPGEIEGGEPGSKQSANAGGGFGNATQGGPKFPAPAGMPGGQDDDVVARQLREAAETEKDPELRAKLWEEYKKYKTRKS